MPAFIQIPQLNAKIGEIGVDNPKILFFSSFGACIKIHIASARVHFATFTWCKYIINPLTTNKLKPNSRLYVKHIRPTQ